MGRMIGYARVSTDEQSLGAQTDALKNAGCELLFTDKASGAKITRPGLDHCLQALEPGDVLVVVRLDRLGRSLAHLVSLVEQLQKQDVGFRSLQDGQLNTTSPTGQLVFHIFAALAQFERELIRERTRAGLKAARARGRKGGRKPVLASNPKVKAAKLMHQGQMPIGDICRGLQISRATFYRYLKL